jgi:DNA-binding NtrC family response regulator
MTLDESAPSGEPEAPGKRQHVRSDMSEAKGRVLIVDDEEAIRRFLRQALEMEGYSCIPVCSGAEALEAVSQQNFDLVLLDMRMPGMSGLEVLSKLSEAHPDTCVIMVTALVDVSTSVRAMKMGAYDYLTKPLDLSTLLESTERALERRRLVLKTRSYRLQLEEMVQKQGKQIRDQFRELVQTLAREQVALQELQALRQVKGLDSMPLSPGMRKPAASVEEFAARLLDLVGGH